MRFQNILSLAILAALAAVPASAHVFPTKAKSLKASLVQNYAECTTPDTFTNGGDPACLETDPVDTTCGFGPGASSGSLSVTASGPNLAVKVSLKGLNCEGEVLTVALGVRTTTDDCVGGHCTVADEEIVGGTCTVTGGKCTIKASLPSGYPEDAGTEFTIRTCAVRRGGLDTFVCGVMVP